MGRRLACIVSICVGVAGCFAPVPQEPSSDAGVNAEGDAGTQPSGADGGDAGACADDGREENDGPTSGTAASAMQHIVGGSIDLPGQVACPGDDDFLRGYADCCPGLGVTVRWDAAQGPLDVQLLTPAGAPIALIGPADVEVRDAGYVHLLDKDQGNGEFLVRVRSASRVEYDATMYAPVYGP